MEETTDSVKNNKEDRTRGRRETWSDYTRPDFAKG